MTPIPTQAFHKSDCLLADKKQCIIVERLRSKFEQDMDNVIPLRSVRNFLSKGLPPGLKISRKEHMRFLALQQSKGRLQVIYKRWVRL